MRCSFVPPYLLQHLAGDSVDDPAGELLAVVRAVDHPLGSGGAGAGAQDGRQPSGGVAALVAQALVQLQRRAAGGSGRVVDAVAGEVPEQVGRDERAAHGGLPGCRCDVGPML
ncbi:MAG: hypothetical protein ACJ72K_10300, partial [Friedmanniella sp.]